MNGWQPLAISTWAWGETAVRAAGAVLNSGGRALDAAVAGATAVEDDPSVRSVGFGGIGNRIGTLSLDACVMAGDLRTGAVACVENIRHVARLAQRVMEKTPHLLLVGEGARWFALEEGFRLENLQTPEGMAEWAKRCPKPEDPQPLGHDTVTTLTRDSFGELAGACTTSGLYFKRPGRVGDSPIVGSGLLVDNEVGAAGGTGVGEEILRANGSHVILEAMRAGQTPQEACRTAVRRVLRNQIRLKREAIPVVCFIAMSAEGTFGAACTRGSKFPFATLTGSEIKVQPAEEVDA